MFELFITAMDLTYMVLVLMGLWTFYELMKVFVERVRRSR